jgi:hypothetical protein
MDHIHVCFAVLLANDDPRTSWSFQKRMEERHYTDHQVEQRIHKNAWWISKVMMDSGIDKERPERPIHMQIVQLFGQKKQEPKKCVFFIICLRVVPLFFAVK